jgi:hypothetical protein
MLRSIAFIILNPTFVKGVPLGATDVVNEVRQMVVIVELFEHNPIGCTRRAEL